MRRKFYTIFILPHANSRFRKIHLSKNFLISIFGVLGLFVLAGIAVPHLLFKVQAQGEAVNRLLDENRKLREEKRHFEASLSEMGNLVAMVEDRAKRIAAAVGVKRSPADEPSGGLGVRKPTTDD